MELIKKFTALKIDTNNIDGDIQASLTHGSTSGPYYNRSNPEVEFNNESDAIDHAFKDSPYGTWLIIPVIRFKN